MNDQLKELLAKKNIDAALFASTKEGKTQEEKSSQPILEIKMESKSEEKAHAPTPDVVKKINAVCAALFHAVYSKPYKNEENQNKAIMRFYHGIQHVARVAMYIPVFANLYRRYGDPEALKLTNEDLFLLSIAGLFHDGARENEDEDLWDHESALLSFYFFKDVLKVDPEKAAMMAEAIANKDQKDIYFKLVEKQDKPGEYDWRQEPRAKKNIMQKIIQNADCMDIMRARDLFEGDKYLDFYKDYAESNPQAFEELATIRLEIKDWITLQGDARRMSDYDLKKPYNTPDAYLVMRETLTKERYPVLSTLYADAQLLSGEALKQKLLDGTPFDPGKGVTKENIEAAMREGRFIGRGFEHLLSYREKHSPHGKELQSQTELRKIYRRKGKPTRTHKPDKMEKEGSHARSVFGAGWGEEFFSNVFLFVLNPDPAKFSSISGVDADTGRGKKKHIYKDLPPVDAKKNQVELSKILRKQKMGGNIRYAGFQGQYTTHSEKTYHLTEVDGIGYCDEWTDSMGVRYLPHSAFLQALYLQQEHERMTKVKPPLVRFSTTSNRCEMINTEFKKEEIVKMWAEMATACLDREFWTIANTIDNHTPVDHLSVDRIKLKCVKSNAESADILYPQEWRDAIDKEIEKIKQQKINEHKARYEMDLKRSPGLPFGIKGRVLFDFLIHTRLDSLSQETKGIVSAKITELLAKPDDFLTEASSLAKFNGKYERVSLNDTLSNKLQMLSHSPMSTLMKSYLLAVKFNLLDEAKKLQAIAIGFLMKNIKEAALDYDSSYVEYTRFMQFIDVVAFFDIYPQVEKEITGLLRDGLNQAKQKLEKNPLDRTVVYSTLQYVAVCVKRKVPLDAQNAAIVSLLLDHAEPFMRQYGYARDVTRVVPLDDYLLIADEFKLPLARKKQVALQSIMHSILEGHYLESFTPALQKSGLLADEEIVIALISRMTVERFAGFDGWIKFLGEHMPGGVFNDKQKALIQKQREFFQAFHQNKPEIFLRHCKEEKAFPHLVFASAKIKQILDFLAPFLLTEKFLKKGKILDLSPAQENPICPLLIEKIIDDFIDFSRGKIDNPLVDYYQNKLRNGPEKRVRYWGCFWKNVVDPNYNQKLILIGLMANQFQSLSQKDFAAWLDHMMTATAVKDLADPDFQAMLKELRASLKVNGPANEVKLETVQPKGSNKSL